MKETTGDFTGVGFCDFVVQYLFRKLKISDLYFAYINIYDVNPIYANANVIMSDEEVKPINGYPTVLIKMPNGEFIDMAFPNDIIFSMKTDGRCRVIEYIQPFLNYCSQEVIPKGEITGLEAKSIAKNNRLAFENNRILALTSSSQEEVV